MDCQEITQIPVVQEAISDPGKNKLLERIFNCVYKLYCPEFINWILGKNAALDHDVTREMAKDAFQEGLIAFLSKIKQHGLVQKASLRTIIFVFGLWQFRALKKKYLKHNTVPYNYKLAASNSSDEPGFTEITYEDKTYWNETLEIVYSEEEYQLHNAINKLPENCRNVLYQFYFDKLKPKTIAAKMNVSVEHVYNILCQARKALKEILILRPDF